MSMYSQLLSAALDQTHPPSDDSTTGEALANLLERRSYLGARLASHPGSKWAPGAVADQLAYDIALIEIARQLGIEVDLNGFDQPENERARLERALLGRGVPLDDLDGSMSESQR